MNIIERLKLHSADRPKPNKESPLAIELSIIRDYLLLTPVHELGTNLVEAGFIQKVHFDKNNSTQVVTLKITVQIPERYRLNHAAVKAMYNFLTTDNQLRNLLFCSQFATRFAIYFPEIDPKSEVELAPGVSKAKRQETWYWFEETWQAKTTELALSKQARLDDFIDQLVLAGDFAHFERFVVLMAELCQYNTDFPTEAFLFQLDHQLKPILGTIWAEIFQNWTRTSTLDELNEQIIPVLSLLVKWNLTFTYQQAIDQILSHLKTDHPSTYRELYSPENISLKAQLLQLRQGR